MSIKWGSWVSSRFRIGLDITQSPATFTSSVTTVNVNAKLYWQTYYYGWDTGIDWSISGAASASGTTAFDHNGDMQYTLLGQVNKTVTPVVSGPITSTFSGSASGWSAYGGTATVSDSHITQQKPVALPAAPTGVGATRVSDTQHTITWTRNATTAAPYTNLYVERWDNVTNKYALIATIAGTATSYSNTNTVANRQYRWRVRAKNGAGYSGYNYTGYLKTTPAAPSAPTATKTATSDIQVTWASNSAITENVEVWHAANGVWDGTALATIGNVTSYTHTAPNATQTHKYRLRAKVTGPSLTSAYSSETGTVQLAAPPNAPTNLSPTATTWDADTDLTVSWQHNPVDTSPQSYRETRYRVNGGAWVQPGRFATSVQNRVYTAGTFTNGTTVEWQVRTWGAATTGGSLGNGDSPWSATATLVMSSKPTVAINFPDPGVAVTTAQLTAEWGYFDAEGSPQSSWKIWLYDISGQQVAYLTGNGTETSATIPYVLQDAGTYTLAIQVRDSVGSWSDIEDQLFTVAYAPPPQPVPTLMWQEETGTVDIQGTVRAPIARSNKITNGSFEDVTLGNWAGGTSAVLELVTDIYHSGAQSVKVYCPIVGGYLQRTDRVEDADAGETWTLSAWVLGKAGEQVDIEFRGLDTLNATTLSTKVTHTLTGQWQRIWTTVTFPVNTTRGWPLILGKTADQTFWVDDVMAEQTSTVYEYANGTYTEVAATSFNVYRSEDAGLTYTRIATNVAPQSTWVDNIPPLNKLVYYKVESVSSTPSAAKSEPISVYTSCLKYKRIWLNVGPGFEKSIFLSPNATIDMSVDRAKTLHQFAGRPLPVEFAGINITRILNVKGVLIRDTTDEAILTPQWDEVEDVLMNYPAPACLRDLRGHRWFVSVDNNSWSGPQKRIQDVGFVATQIDWSEDLL